MEFTITSSQVLGVCGLIASLWGVWKIAKELNKPSSDLKKKVEKHDRILDEDNERLKDVEQSTKMILQCLLVIINHDITGNGVEKMKVCRDELQDYLINK